MSRILLILQSREKRSQLERLRQCDIQHRIKRMMAWTARRAFSKPSFFCAAEPANLPEWLQRKPLVAHEENSNRAGSAVGGDNRSDVADPDLA